MMSALIEKVRFPFAVTNPEISLWDRFLLICLINGFHCYRWSLISADKLKSSDSLHKLRNSTHAHAEFRGFVWRICVMKLKNYRAIEDNSNQQVTSLNTNAAITMPSSSSHSLLRLQDTVNKLPKHEDTNFDEEVEDDDDDSDSDSVEKQSEVDNFHIPTNTKGKTALLYFNTEEGRKHRFDEPHSHTLGRGGTQRRCILCGTATKFRCDRCDISLCNSYRGGNKRSCFRRMHEDKELLPIQVSNKKKRTRKT